MVSRKVALEILNEILTGWQLRPAQNNTITGVNLSGVQQSDLERMFKVLLQRWSSTNGGRVDSRPDPDNASLNRFDLHFQDGPHWEIREQQNLVNHRTRPDFYATRVDAAGTAPVAIYLDGWEWHGKNLERVNHDALRRQGVRLGGTSVWVLTHPDVKGALDAVNKESKMGPVTPLSNPVRHDTANAAIGQRGGKHSAFEAVRLGAFDQLMAFLADPEPLAWNQLAQAMVLSSGKGGVAIPVADAKAALTAAATGQAQAPADYETGTTALVWSSLSGQEGTTILVRDQDTVKNAVLSYDMSIETERSRWSDWLHLGNIVQYLGDGGIITTTTAFSEDPLSQGAPEESRIEVTTDELLVDVVDGEALTLAAAAVNAGWTDVTVGFESGDDLDTPIEVAWPVSRVGILPTGVQRPITLEEWDLREPSAWTTEELLKALEQGGR